MLSLSERQIIAKNSLHTEFPWLFLCELQVNDAADTYHRWVQNYEDMVFMLATYGGSDIVAHYKLNDNAWNTNVADSSGNGMTGTAQRNTVHLATSGKNGVAHQQNGSSDYTNCNDPFESTLQGSFSISLWAKPADGQPGVVDILVGALDSTGDNSLIYLAINTSGQVQVRYESEGNLGQLAITDSVIFADGAASNWTHIVLVANATIGGVGGKKIYIAGVDQDLDSTYNGSTSGVTFSQYTSAQSLFLGGYNANGTPANWYEGGLDNIIIFSKALTQAEITALYNAGNGTEKVPAVFTGFNFDVDSITYKGGEVPTTALRISNVTQFLKSDLEANRGCTSSDIVLRVVHAEDLYEAAALTLNFDVIAPRITAKYVEFTLGGPSPLRRRVPLDRYYADSCRYVGEFKGPRCGYAGGETSCSGLRSRCRELSNETSFGGFAGLRPEGLQLA